MLDEKSGLAKSFAIDEARRIDFRVETFNLPNHPNFNVPSGPTAFSNVNAAGVPTVAPNWGVITSTVTKSRQIQFGLKLVV